MNNPYYDDSFSENESENSNIIKFENLHENTVFNDAVIFLVQVSDKLYDQIEDYNCSFYEMIIKGFENFVKSKIISNTKDNIGLIFFDCNTTDNKLNYQNIFVHSDLQQPSKQMIHNIQQLYLKGPELSKNSKTDFIKLILLCNSIFRTKLIQKNYFKRIFLFTHKDDPECEWNNSFSKDKLVNEMNELGIEFEIFPIIQTGEKFEYSKFYSNFMQNNDDTVLNYDTIDKFKDLLSKLRKKEFKKRALCGTFFNISDSVKIGVKIYSLFKKMRKPTGTMIDSETQNIIKKEKKYFSVETETFIDDNNIKRFVTVADEKIPIEPEKLKEIDINLGIKLLDFRPMHELKPYMNLRPSYYIYPDEDMVKNSKLFTDAFIKELISQEKFALCKFFANKSKVPSLSALIANKNNTNSELHTDGLHLIVLPYKNDYRKLDKTNQKSNNYTFPKKKDVDIAGNLIDKMTIGFNFRQFENPEIQKFYKYLQNIALYDNYNLESYEDYLNPDIKGFEEIAADINNFSKHFFESEASDAHIQSKNSTPKKRNN